MRCEKPDIELKIANTNRHCFIGETIAGDYDPTDLLEAPGTALEVDTVIEYLLAIGDGNAVGEY